MRKNRLQMARRQQMESERLQARMEVLYDDRLDVRIDAATLHSWSEEIARMWRFTRSKRHPGRFPQQDGDD